MVRQINGKYEVGSLEFTVIINVGRWGFIPLCEITVGWMSGGGAAELTPRGIDLFPVAKRE